MEDKTKEILEQEYNENVQKINDLEYKSWITRINSFDRKFELSTAFAMIPWIAIMFTTTLIAKSNIVPLELIQPLSIGVPALIGITGQQILYKKKKYKQELKEVSNAKSEKELIEENTRYDLEKAKLQDKNRAIKKTYDDLEANQIFLKTYSSRYIISEKEEKDIPDEDLKQKISDITNILEEEQEKLEKKSVKKFLSERFWRIRDKLQRFDYIIAYGGLGFLMPYMIYNLPGIAIIAMGLPLNTSSFEMFAPGVIGLVVGSTYGLNKRKNQLSAFNKINNELGDEKLPQFRNDGDSDEYEQQLTKQIEKVSATKMQLETTKRKLETNQEVDPTVNSLELAEQYLKHSQHYDDCLREQNDRELAMAEKSAKESYKETLIRTIEQFLPMSYEEFKKLDLDEQQRIIDSVKEQQGNIQKDLFQQRFDSYISDLEEDSDLHLGLIEEDEEDMKDYNKPKVLKRRNIKKILDDDIED